MLRPVPVRHFLLAQAAYLPFRQGLLHLSDVVLVGPGFQHVAFHALLDLLCLAAIVQSSSSRSFSKDMRP